MVFEKVLALDCPNIRPAATKCRSIEPSLQQRFVSVMSKNGLNGVHSDAAIFLLVLTARAPGTYTGTTEREHRGALHESL